MGLDMKELSMLWMQEDVDRSGLYVEEVLPKKF